MSTLLGSVKAVGARKYGSERWDPPKHGSQSLSRHKHGPLLSSSPHTLTGCVRSRTPGFAHSYVHFNYDTTNAVHYTPMKTPDVYACTIFSYSTISKQNRK